MISVYYRFTNSAIVDGPRTIGSKAKRKDAQRGLMSIIDMILKAQQRGDIVDFDTDTTDVTKINFTFRSGHEAQLIIILD